MPPKARAKSTDSKKKTTKKGYPGEPPDEKQQILDYLEGVTSSEATEEDVMKTFKLLEQGLSQSDRPQLQAACATIERICEEGQGLHAFMDAKGVETLLAFTRRMQKASFPKSDTEAVTSAAAGIYRQAAHWLDDIDEVDFNELPYVLKLAHWLGAEDEDVALASLSAMERFVLYRLEHAVTLLSSDALTIVHRIIGHQRAPELVTEAFILLFRLTDIAAKLVVPLLHRENGLISTVVEAMTQAPLNMRLQLAGLRLLCLWGQLQVPEEPGEVLLPGEVKNLREPIRQAKAFETGQTIISNLSRSGFTHAASWMSAIASRLPRPGSSSGNAHGRGRRRSTADGGGRRKSMDAGSRRSSVVKRPSKEKS
eukprot:TRINITY_DN4730_c2_g2_i1.p1 TRINITY_DN4730_c2_g2~~TRINITY_DN4730_c2_g2_i1.p1  ORF type:complete len:387 (+),score=86.76 TRINITY_DN4730_c2_g2_i1:58-1161(+)